MVLLVAFMFVGVAGTGPARIDGIRGAPVGCGVRFARRRGGIGRNMCEGTVAFVGNA